MTKQQITIEVDVPEGMKARVIDSSVTAKVKDGERIVTYVEYTPDWQWPAALAANWKYLTMNSGGRWFFSRSEPYIQDDGIWGSIGGWAQATAFTDFTPPPCTDWRQSKRRRPV